MKVAPKMMHMKIGTVRRCRVVPRRAITDLVWPLLIMEHDLRPSDARSRILSAGREFLVHRSRAHRDARCSKAFFASLPSTARSLLYTVDAALNRRRRGLFTTHTHPPSMSHRSHGRRMGRVGRTQIPPPRRALLSADRPLERTAIHSRNHALGVGIIVRLARGKRIDRILVHGARARRIAYALARRPS